MKYTKAIICFISTVFITMNGCESAITAVNPPNDINVVDATNSSLKIQWTETNTGDTFKLFRDISSDGLFSTQIYDGPETSYIDNSLVEGHTYYYRIMTTNNTGSSPYSNVVSGSTIDDWILWSSNDFSSSITTGYFSTPYLVNGATMSLQNDSCVYSGTQANSWGTIYTAGLSISSTSKIKLYVEPLMYNEQFSLGTWNEVFSVGWAAGRFLLTKVDFAQNNGTGGAMFFPGTNHNVSSFVNKALELIIEGTKYTLRIIDMSQWTVIFSASVTNSEANVSGNAGFRCDGAQTIIFDNIKVFTE